MMRRLGGLLALVLLLGAVAPAAQALEVQRVVSPGGIEAWLVEDHSNPILAVQFSFLGGSALDPIGKEGLARMASALLDEGAGPLDSQAFQQELQRLSIELYFTADDDELSGTLITLTRNRERAAELLALALTEPRFDEEPVERVRDQFEVRLARKLSEPQSLAYDALDSLIFQDHPYGRPAEGTSEGIAALSAADLAAFVRERMAQDTLKVGVVGDITPEELGLLLDRTFGLLPAESPAVSVPEAAIRFDHSLQVIPLPVPQSVVFLAQNGPRRDDPDFYAAEVVNHILGGGTFSSRLYKEVRESRGLAYGVWSDITPRQHAGTWVAGVATQNARVGEALAVILETWDRLASEGPTDAEVEAAIAYLTGSFPLRLTSSSGIAGLLVSMQREELGIDYIDTRAAYYEALTPDEVRRVAREWLSTSQMTIVVAGQPEGLEALEGFQAE